MPLVEQLSITNPADSGLHLSRRYKSVEGGGWGVNCRGDMMDWCLVRGVFISSNQCFQGEQTYDDLEQDAMGCIET